MRSFLRKSEQNFFLCFEIEKVEKKISEFLTLKKSIFFDFFYQKKIKAKKTLKRPVFVLKTLLTFVETIPQGFLKTKFFYVTLGYFRKSSLALRWRKAVLAKNY